MANAAVANAAVANAAVANAATVHADTHTVSSVSPDDGGAGNG